MKRLIFFALITAALVGCRSIPEARPADTSAQQAQVHDAIQDIKSFPQDSTAGPKDIMVVARARAALEVCGQSLERTTRQLNECSSKVSAIASNYREQGARLQKLQNENGFFGRMGRFFKTLFLGAIFGIGLYLLIRDFGAIAWQVAKSKIP